MTVHEISVQIRVVHELKKLLKDDWRIMHPPNEEVQAKRTISKQMALGMLPGAPDLIAFSPEGKAHFMEFKAPKGVLSREQEKFQLWCVRSNLPHSVVRSIDQAMKVFEFWGCLRGTRMAAE